MSEQVLDVKGSVKLVRRFWRTVLVFVVLGAAAAEAYAIAVPGRYRATALVLLPGARISQAGTRTLTITTATGIATSSAVLAPAGRRAGSSLSLTALEHSVTATAATGSVLQITASGSSARQAERLANAVAGGLVSFVTSSSSVANDHALTGVLHQIERTSAQLKAVQVKLGLARQRLAVAAPRSAGAKQDAATVTDLTARQANLTFELNGLKTQAAQDQLNRTAANQGTEVIQRAAIAASPSVAMPILDALVGAVGGLVVGSVVVLAWRRHDPRLWTRDAISQAVGAPVVLSLEVAARQTSPAWDALFDTYRPSAAESWNVRRALRELGAGERGAPGLFLLSYADDAAGVSLALQAVVVAASSGLETAVSVVAGEHVLSLLQAACARLEARGAGARPGLTIRAGDVARGEGPTPDLTVTVYVLDRQQPWIPTLHRRAAKTVLSVSAGLASAEQLAQLAIAADGGGEPVQAVFVANPVPDDHTAGRDPEVIWPRTTPYRAVDASGWLADSYPPATAGTSGQTTNHTSRPARDGRDI